MLLPVIRFGDLSPRVARSARGNQRFRPRFYTYLRAISDFRPLAFPQLFPQLWKTSGGDPTDHLTRARGTDCNMRRFRVAIDTLGSRSLVFKFLLRGVHRHEGQTYFSAEPAAPEENPRVSRPDVHEEGPPGLEAPARQGPQT